jgi:hypothetical protein
VSKLIIILIAIVNFPFDSSACEAWFEKLKIKDPKQCIIKCSTAPVDMSNYLCRSQCDQLCKNLGKKTEKEPNFYDLTDDEITFCKENKVDCLKAYGLSYFAEQKCLEIYPASDHNNESDACRHYVWSYFLSKEFGIVKALRILNAHENNPKQSSKEKSMDTHNNELAINDFKVKKNIDADQVLSKFKENLKNKKFKIIRPTYSTSGGLP